MLVAGLLRFWQLGELGLRGDEAVYAGQAAVIAGYEAMERHFILYSRGNSNFLLYQYILSLFYMIGGVSDVTARQVSAFFSLMTVLVVFELARTLYGRLAAFIAAALLALSAYAIFLGRLALLDSTLVFFFTLTLLCLAKWLQSQHQNHRWLYLGAAAAGLAIDTKVVSVLLLAIVGLVFVLTQAHRELTWRPILISLGIFILALAPALWLIGSDPALFFALLSQSIQRVSNVPWLYYPRTLIKYDGFALLVLALFGLILAAVRRNWADWLLISWVAVVVIFLQTFPLKAFNYLAPLMPALCILAAGAVAAIWPAIRWRGALVGLLVLVTIAPYTANAMRIRDYAGLREASYWLQENAPPQAGVMTLSQGSAQYVLAFYGDLNAYPFGRFRLATVLPGGTVVSPHLTRSGRTPTDWTVLWPPKLVESGAVSYLVYYTNAGDDPPEDPLVATATERQFQRFIEAYGGNLVHTVYYNHEPRVWVYEVTRRLAQPVVDFTMAGNNWHIEGEGFRFNGPVALYYNGIQIAQVHADDRGSFVVELPLPADVNPIYFLVAVDETGQYASTTGRHIWGEVGGQSEPALRERSPSESPGPGAATDEQGGDTP